MRALASGLAIASILSCAPGGEVPLHEVRRGSFRRLVQAEGALRAVTSTPLTVPHSDFGVVKVIWILEDGTFVREGDLLVRFDPTSAERELFEGEIALAGSERRLEQREVQTESSLSGIERDRRLARLELDLARRFAEKDPDIFSRVEILESRIDERLAAEKLDHAGKRAETETELARSEMELISIEKRVAASKIERAKSALGALELRAPHDGIVVLARDRNGNTLQPGNTTFSRHPIGEIPALDRMEAVVQILEADAGGLKEGAPATLAVEGRPGRSFSAKIRHVDRMPMPRLRGVPVQYFEATLELEKTEPAIMKPGQRVIATIGLEELAFAISVPRQAVFQNEEGRFVYRRKEEGGFEKVPVALGPASLGRIVIEEGLSEGDLIAVRDPERSRSELLPDREEPSSRRPRS